MNDITQGQAADASKPNSKSKLPRSAFVFQGTGYWLLPAAMK
jgi:hypothetical protein